MGLNELYSSIVDDVVENVKEAFSEEGVDEQILKSLKEAWLRRIRESQQPRQTTQQQQLPQQQSQSQPQHPQQTSVIVYNNNISNSSISNNNNNHNNLHTQPPQSNDNLDVSTALNLSQHHRQQTVAELADSNQRTQQLGDGTNSNTSHLPQLDGSNGISDDDDDNDDESDGDFPDGDDDVDVSDEEDKETDANREDEDPLNSGDDVSNDESSEMFETDNVVVCQYDKITRNRNKWKFHLKDGIMNINGRDYVFQKAVGDAEW